MLQKSARVFASKRAWIGFAVLCLVLAGTFSAARFGFFGYSQKVPDVRSVSSVSLRGTRVTEKDDIEAVVALHQEIVDQQETQLALLQSEPYDNCYITFDYDMQDGSTLRRRFTINGSCELARKFDTLYNSPGFLLSREVIPGELKQSDFAGGAIQGYDKNNEPYYYNLSSKEAYELYTTCILRDFQQIRVDRRLFLNIVRQQIIFCLEMMIKTSIGDTGFFADILDRQLLITREPYRGNLLAQLLLRSHAGRCALPRLRRGARLPRALSGSAKNPPLDKAADLDIIKVTRGAATRG